MKLVANQSQLLDVSFEASLTCVGLSVGIPGDWGDDLSVHHLGEGLDLGGVGGCGD